MPSTSAPATPTPTPSQTGVQEFGKAYTYADGLSVTIGAPQPYKPSEYAAGKEGFSKFVSFEVVIVNKTGKVFEPVAFHTSMQSANQEASPIFDSGNKISGPPSTKLLDGRESKFKIAYGVTDPNDLVMEVMPDFEHASVLFQKG